MNPTEFEQTEQEGEGAKMNIAIQYELHLLDIISRYNEAYRIGNYIVMGKEVEMLYHGVFDKVQNLTQEERDKHAKYLHDVRNLVSSLVFLYGRPKFNSLFAPATASSEDHIRNTEWKLLQLASEWKMKLVEIMSKNNMLVTHHKGFAGAINQ